MTHARRAAVVAALGVLAAITLGGAAVAAPPDAGPIDGEAVATQDPPGSCAGRPNEIPFDATVELKDGDMIITDPGGTTSGSVRPDGTATLTGTTESYELLSSTPMQLTLREVNGGCTFSTVIDLASTLPSLISTPATTASPSTTTTTEPTEPAVADTATSDDGNNLDWLWLSTAGLGVVVVGVGVATAKRKPTVDDLDLDILGAMAIAYPGESTVPTLDDLRAGFDRKQEQLVDALETKLSELSRFEVAYGQAWNGAVAATKSYVHDYRPIVNDLKKIWDAFPDRDWANARAKYVEDVINYSMITYSLGKGMITSISAAEAAYQATYAEGTLLKAVSAIRQPGATFSVTQDLVKSVEAAKALHAARWAQRIRFAEQALAKGAPQVAHTAFATQQQNLSWIKSWVGKFKLNPFNGTSNCQLTTQLVTDVLSTGRTDVFAPALDAATYDIAKTAGTTMSTTELANAVGGQFVDTTMTSIGQALAGEVHGTQYWVYVWQGENAHIFNAVNLNGTTFFIDGQVAKVATSAAEVLQGSCYTAPNVSFMKVP